MAILKCKMCGGNLELTEAASTAICEYCGSVQTVPKADDEKKLTLFARANRLRAASEFDKAAGVYETIVADFPEEAEAYWGLVLCRYGIEYVDDPKTGKKVPTCHRSSFDSVMTDSDFQQALENADPYSRRIYREEAKQIEQLRKDIIAASANEKPYDIFICYKETAENGQRTLDSVLAQDIYEALMDKGYRVFFARITLEDKLGAEYEPVIFAALHSAKIMLAVGTDYEYFNAVWVRNEWGRYLKLMEKDRDRHLIPCYKGLDAYDMPPEFAKLQAQDLGKVGATQDLLRGIEKIMPLHDESVKETVVVQQMAAPVAGVESLLKRAFMFLEDGNWTSANEYCEKVLDMDPECAIAYVGKLMAELKVNKQEELKNLAEPFDGNGNYGKAIRYGDAAIKTGLITCVEEIKTRNQKAEYQAACKAMEQACTEIEFRVTAGLFEKLKEYEDSAQRMERCLIQAKLAGQKAREKKRRVAIITAVFAVMFTAIVGGTIYIINTINGGKYDDAMALMASGQYAEAAAVFQNLGGYKDSRQKYEECYGKTPDWVYDQILAMAQQGQKAQAAMAFYKMGDFKDARQRSFELWAQVAHRETISAGSCTIAVKADGMVVAQGHNEDGECNVSDWTDIVAISAGGSHTVGLKKDGTVVAVGYNYHGQCNVEGWTDIVAISADFAYTVGLKADGTVVATGDNDHGQCDVSDWTDIVAISAGDEHTVGLKADGTVVAVGLNDYGQCDVERWRDIVSICVNRSHTVGLKKDGTVVAVGNNYYGRCNVEGWTDIVAISADFAYTVGLKADGTVVATGDNYHGQCDVSDWTDIVAIRAGNDHTVGLKADGTVVAVGANSEEQYDVSAWRDIVAIRTGGGHTVGVKADGTVVSTGQDNYTAYKMEHWSNIAVVDESYKLRVGLKKDGTVVAAGDNDYGECNVTGWRNIVAVSAEYSGTIGLKSDGTVVATGNYSAYEKEKLSTWRDIVAIDACSEIIGLKKDGTVVAFGTGILGNTNVSDWRNIVAISTSYYHTVGLKADGTVVSTWVDSAVYNQGQCDVSGWRNIKAISAEDNYTVGLRTDGTVVAVGNNYAGKCNVSDWTNIAAISAGGNHTVGLKSNGTVVAVGDNDYGQCDVSNWTGIVSICASEDTTIGVKADGTVLVAGKNPYEGCNISGWTNIKIPNT